MNDYATPRHMIALAELLDEAAFDVKVNGGANAGKIAARLRRLADILEHKI